MLSLGVLKMNKVWTALLVIGIVVSFLTGSIDKLGTVIVESATDAFNIFLKVALLILFWNGVFNIAIQSGLIKNITKLLKKPLSFLFPDVDKDSVCMEYIFSNMVANMLGLGSAATPLGLKAFEMLQNENKKDHPSRAMMTFVLLNISTLTLFPTTIISLRAMYKGTTEFSFIVLMILVTLFATIFTILLDRIVYVIQSKKGK